MRAGHEDRKRIPARRSRGRQASGLRRRAPRRHSRSPPEEHRAYASETGVGELLGILRNGSLFSSRRIVEYRGAELIKGKEDIGALAAYLVRPAPDAVLLLVTDAFFAEKALERRHRQRSQTDLFRNVREREASMDREKAARARPRYRRGRHRGLARARRERIGRPRCGLLASGRVFPARDVPLGEDDVEAAIARNRQEDAFSLFGRIATGVSRKPSRRSKRCSPTAKATPSRSYRPSPGAFSASCRLHVLIEEGEGLESACMKLQIREQDPATPERRGHPPLLAARSASASSYSPRSSTRKPGPWAAAYEHTLLQLFIYGILIKKGDSR